MDNKIFIRIEKIIACLFCALSLFYIILLAIDLFQFISDPSDYAIVYQKYLSDKEWVSDYIIQGIIYIGICLLIFGLSIWRLVKSYKTLRIILNFIYIFVIIAISIGYYKWYLTGFDHP
jgi:hypothetical protein